MKNINEVRQELGMNLTRFAEFTGIPYRTVQNWELGTNKCPLYVLEMINELIQSNIDRSNEHVWIVDGKKFLTKGASDRYAEANK